MTEETLAFVEPDYASHPGALLAEELEARGLSQRELARRIGRPFQVVNEIARERKAITAETAVQLEAELGIRAYLWLAMQSKHDLVAARRKLAAASSAS